MRLNSYDKSGQSVGVIFIRHLKICNINSAGIADE